MERLTDMKPLGVALVGCGSLGRKRAGTLRSAVLRICADSDSARANSLSKDFNCRPTTNWREAVAEKGVDIVIVSTSNDALSEVSIEALKAGRHVLIEKPAARNSREIEAIEQTAERQGTLVRVGFNHRYHPAFRKAFKLLASGCLGPLMFIRASYGHGGRVGYEKEWRMNPELSGGGELIDQGVHLIDLARCFLGDFEEIIGRAETFYWNAPADDNAFMLLKTADKRSAFLHVSCTEWKNSFSFEIYGRNGKIHITGLGGSYGVERLSLYTMRPEMGPPDTTAWEYPMPDSSFSAEFQEFLDDIRLHRKPSAGLHDALAAMRVVERVYEQSKGYQA